MCVYVISFIQHNYPFKKVCEDVCTHMCANGIWRPGSSSVTFYLSFIDGLLLNSGLPVSARLLESLGVPGICPFLVLGSQLFAATWSSSAVLAK